MSARRDRLGFLDSYAREDKELLITIFQDYKKDGLKINAIKKIRTLLNTGLVESKDLIECMEEYGVDEILKLGGFKYRFEKHRKINLEAYGEQPGQIKLICPICRRDAIDAVAVVAKSGKRIGYFCRKCYDYLITPTTLVVPLEEWEEIKRGVSKINEFVERLQKK